MKKTAIDKIIEKNDAEIAKLQAVNQALRHAQTEGKRKRKATSVDRVMDAQAVSRV